MTQSAGNRTWPAPAEGGVYLGQAQDEAAQSYRELEDFFENGAVGLHIVGSDGIIRRANRAELALLGYTAEEYVGRPIAQFHADREVIADILQRLSRGERIDRYPARLRAKDGSIRYVEITSSGAFQDGVLRNTRCFTVDVTDRRKADEALRESQQRLAATFANAPVGVIETDEAGRFVRVNAAFRATTGYTDADLRDRSFLDITHPDDRESDRAFYAQQVRGEIDRYAIEKRYLCKDGSTVIVDVRSSSIRDADGSFRYAVRVVQDVTERRRAEALLAENERRLRDLLEAVPAAVYTTDAQGRITFYNQAAVALSGREPKLGSDQWCVTWRLYHTDGTPLPHDQCPMAIALKEDRPIRGAEAVAERPDGTRVPFIPFPTPLHDASGKLIGAINMLVDISERKAAEERLLVLVNELNHRVKNTLATVQSIAAQTFRSSPEPAAFRPAFEARLMSLSNAHELLTRNSWAGVGLRELCEQALAPHAEDGGRTRLEGDEIRLAPRVALVLGMVLHELATNAAKYGALSAGDGVVTLAWKSVVRGPDAAPWIELTWRERGGPQVQPPTRRGFGLQLVERSVLRDLAGEVAFAFDADGFACTIAVAHDQA